MAKILILAESGFGKSSSIGHIPELNIEGLKPEETYVISATSKPLPFRGSGAQYKVVPDIQNLKEGNRIITNKGEQVANIITALSGSPFKNIVLDDANYIMQDYYMANSLKKGYDVFKQIGVMMDQIFSAAELLENKHFIMMAHFEEYKSSTNDTISYRFKTVGKMVQDYITPEGKFDIVLFGKQSYNDQDKKVNKEFVTNFDGQFPSKSPVGMFNELYIPNDLGYVINKINEYYK
jgi:hypothetical protein